MRTADGPIRCVHQFTGDTTGKIKCGTSRQQGLYTVKCFHVFFKCSYSFRTMTVLLTEKIHTMADYGLWRHVMSKRDNKFPPGYRVKLDSKYQEFYLVYVVSLADWLS